MGRPPKPVELKRAQGNPGHRPLPDPVATIPGVARVPRAPRGLEAAGRKAWRDIWRAGEAWLSPEADYLPAEMAARTVDEVAMYRSVLKGRPLLREKQATPSGKVVGDRFVANPAAKMLRDAERQLERWLSALAIPAADRARLGLIQVRAQSKLEAMFRARDGQPSNAAVEVLDVDGWDDEE